jgi:hypothetical protein
MTYLEAVNNVLVRLREDEVVSVNSTPYSKLIGAFVNDAINEVESAWDWSALRTTLTVTTSSGIFNYNLTGSNNNGKLLDAINDTSNFFMEYKDQHWFNNVFLNNDPLVGSPRYFTYNGVDGNGDTAIDIYPKPDGVYSLRFNMVLRSPRLTQNTDTIKVPYLPIVLLATALASRERGETGGSLTPELLVTAKQALNDAIALDAAKHPEETIFYVG